jgi:hypothetical protein
MQADVSSVFEGVGFVRSNGCFCIEFRDWTLCAPRSVRFATMLTTTIVDQTSSETCSANAPTTDDTIKIARHVKGKMREWSGSEERRERARAGVPDDDRKDFTPLQLLVHVHLEYHE